MPVRRKTIITLSTLLILAIAGSLMGYSYFFPGSVRHIDIVRLPIQSTIMRTFSHYTFDDILPITEAYDSTRYIQMDEFTLFTALLEPGDIMFTNSGRYLSSSFIPGPWKHSLIYLGNKNQLASSHAVRGAVKRALLRLYKDPNEVLILDSSEDGVAIRSFHTLSKLSYNSLLTGLCAFRINRPDDKKARFLNYAFDQLGKPYDWDLIIGETSKLFCSELIYEGLSGIDIDVDTWERTAGRDIISPSSMVDYIINKGIARGEFTEILMVQKDILAEDLWNE